MKNLLIGSVRNWQYDPGRHSRDLRLDVLRGYFVMIMIIDHVGFFPAWTQVLTGANRLWVSAAEGFVIVSGIVFGLLYRVRLRKFGWQWSIKHVFKRSAQLYLITVIGQIIFNTGDYLLRFGWGRPSDLPSSYFELIVNALFQVRYPAPAIQLLPLYSILLPLGLAALYLLEKRQFKWLVLGSYFLWQVRILDPASLSFFRNGFNPATWQILFVAGLAAGYYWHEVEAWWRVQNSAWKRGIAFLLIGLTAVILVFSYQIAFHHLWADIPWLKSNSLVFRKNLLAPGRILTSILVFSGLFLITTLFWKPIERILGWLFLPLGQHALTAYILHAIPVYIFQRLPGFPAPFPGHDPVIMGIAHLLIVLLIWQSTRIISLKVSEQRYLRRNRGAALANQSAD